MELSLANDYVVEEGDEGLNCNTTKKQKRCRSFHFRYLELCRSKNHTPASEIKCKNKITNILDFYGDKVKADDWLMLLESLECDLVLQTIAIRFRKQYGNVEFIDSEKGAKLFKNKPPLYTRYIFNGFIKSLTTCITNTKNLNTLCLEALPLGEQSVVTIAKAISLNEHLKSISFERSMIGDKACEIICNTVKYLPNIEVLNMSQCNLSKIGANHVTDLVKFQKIFRYSEGWKKSLRYREVEADSIPGLRAIYVGHNPAIGDKGLGIICEVLKEDVWIKVMDFEACSITDVGANYLIKCLDINKHIVDFNLRGNPDVSKYLLHHIEMQLGKDEDEIKEQALHPKERKKIAIKKLKDRSKFLEEQIENEKTLRKQVEQLNEQLHQQIMDFTNQIAQLQSEQIPVETPVAIEPQIPDGCIIIDKDELENIIRERDEYKNQILELKPVKSKLKLTKKAVKLRKAKSETKYVETSQKRPMQNKNSKSVHEFAEIRKATGQHKTNKEHVYVESNIGDGSATPCSSILSRRAGTRQQVQNDSHYVESNIGDGLSVASCENSYRPKIKKSIYINTRGETDSEESKTNRSVSSNVSKGTVIISSACTVSRQKLSERSSTITETPKNNAAAANNNGFKNIEEMFRIFVRKTQNMEANFSNEKPTESVDCNQSPRSLFMGSKR